MFAQLQAAVARNLSDDLSAAVSNQLMPRLEYPATSWSIPSYGNQLVAALRAAGGSQQLRAPPRPKLVTLVPSAYGDAAGAYVDTATERRVVLAQVRGWIEWCARERARERES
jgi:hypothetical protein